MINSVPFVGQMLTGSILTDLILNRATLHECRYLIQVCEHSGVGYALGFSRNAVLERKILDLLERARLKHYAAGTWDAPKRWVMKAEWLPNFPLSALS
jgi:hypothetical protein